MLRIAVLLLFGLTPVLHAETKPSWKFGFGSAQPAPDVIRITPESAYTPTAGYGWMAERAGVFAVNVPEGNHEVRVQFDSPAAAAAATVKAESRRLMLMKQEQVQDAVRTFTVNVRGPGLDGGDRVRLTERERNSMNSTWDERLSLEILPSAEAVASIEIRPAPEAVTVHLAGDSTVNDQRDEPWAGWGQMLPRFFAKSVAVANHAESGRALHSFRGEKRLDKILSMMNKGDYLFIQFGHNDQKDKSEGAGPFTSYKENLKQFIDAARSKGGIAVLVTPMERRRWSGGKPQETLTDFAEAVRQVGKEKDAPVIDLHAMSLKLYEALGLDGSKQAFVHYPAGTFPGQDKALKDDTHHNVYGAYQLARCVVEGIREVVPDLAKHLRDGLEPFDPSNPDSPDRLEVPPSSFGAVETPEGS